MVLDPGFHLPPPTATNTRPPRHDINIDPDTSFIINRTPTRSYASSQRSVSPSFYSRSDTPSTLTPDDPSPPYFSPTSNNTCSDKAFHVLDIKLSIEVTLTDADTSTESVPSIVTPPDWVRGVGFWRYFIAVCIPILLSAFEGSVVSTALPSISHDMGPGPQSSWVATSFLLASIICQPLYGQLADIWGRRHLMMIAVVIFGAGSAVAGLAHHIGVLGSWQGHSGVGIGGGLISLRS